MPGTPEILNFVPQLRSLDDEQLQERLELFYDTVPRPQPKTVHPQMVGPTKNYRGSLTDLTQSNSVIDGSRGLPKNSETEPKIIKVNKK